MQSLPDLSQLSHAEKDALIHALWAMVLRLEGRVKELEDRLALSSSNSSKPPQAMACANPHPSHCASQANAPAAASAATVVVLCAKAPNPIRF